LVLSFENKELRKICEEDAEATCRLGNEAAALLQNRLADIFAAETINDILVGNPHKAGEHPFLFYVINLDKHIQLLFRANNIKHIYLKNGELDWAQINRIKLVNILHNHE
jgi:proteic killer suppression protein